MIYCKKSFTYSSNEEKAADAAHYRVDWQYRLW